MQDYSEILNARGWASSPSGPSPIPAEVIPAGAVLLAPRYDGGSKRLAAIPECWCCRESYRLERLEEGETDTYAFLGPACKCLGVPQAISCCGLCVEHCRCGRQGRSTDGQST